MGITPISSWAGDIQHTFEKLSTRATTLLQTSSWLEVYIQVMAPQSCRSPNFGNFGKLPFGSLVPRQNDIWVLILWSSTEYTIRGKVVASPKSEPWWVLWVHVCPWHVCAPKALKLYTNQLVVWFVQVHVNKWCLSLFLVPILELQHALLPPKCCEPRTVPQLLTLLMFSPQTHIWVYQGAWDRVSAYQGSLFNTSGHDNQLLLMRGWEEVTIKHFKKLGQSVAPMVLWQYHP